MNKKPTNLARGFTLVELLVYMAVASIVVVLAGRIFVDTMAFRVRTSERSEAITMANEAMMYLEEDLRRVGAKAKKLDGNFAEVDVSAYWNNPGDSSSFSVTKNTGGAGRDSIAFRSAEYDALGDIIGIASISYSVRTGRLMRRYQMGTTVTNTIIMDSVSRFNLEFGEYTTQAGHADAIVWDQVITAANLFKVSTVGNINSVGVIPVIEVVDNTELMQVQLWDAGAVKVFSLESGATYAVEVNVKPDDATIADYTSDPLANLAAVVFRRTNGTPISSIGDMIFFAGVAAEFRSRYFEFTHGEASTQNAHLFLHFQAPNHKWEVQRIRVLKKTQASMNWVASPTIAQKVRTRAIRAALEVSRGPANRRQQVQIERVIPTPNNGV